MTTAGTRTVLILGNPEYLVTDHAVVDSGCTKCDNGTEFKNHAMNELCAKKGIKREFSVARTPQQNGVAERKNRTLIEAARTMKSDEGYLLGYSTTSKAFREKQQRTKRVEENLHIDFLEDQPNVAGTGPNWMFDLDFLTNTMNYIPVSVENQVNVDAGTQDILMLQMTAQEVVAKALDDATRQAFEEEKRNIASQKRAAQATLPVLTNLVLVGANAGESSFVYLGGKIPIDASTLPNADLPIDPNMPDLEDDSDAFSSDGIFNGAYDDENVGAVADFNNMDDTINVSPIPTLRIHKNHPKDQILGDPKSAVQTRGKIQKASSAQQALFKLEKAWILVDLPSGKKAIGTNWVFKNKRDKRSIIMKNKARLVAQGFRQEEGIDYDEVFAPVARIEAIRLFLAFASYMGFTVYQMDVKSAFLYGTIEEEDKYVADIFKKFNFWSIKTATTPIESNKPLVKDEDGEDVDVHVYRSMIGSLMYLTASRLDIMFAVCACARDSPFELEAFLDSDYYNTPCFQVIDDVDKSTIYF
ncbi:ribonuclease H-like domain-containing protein [Tanacetum coccineum]